MHGGQLQAPCIGQGMSGVAAQGEQMRMRQGQYLFLLRLAVCPHHEFDVHGIRMANGNAGLKPAELHLPSALERIGSGLKPAEIVSHRFQVSKTPATFSELSPPASDAKVEFAR